MKATGIHWETAHNLLSDAGFDAGSACQDLGRRRRTDMLTDHLRVAFRPPNRRRDPQPGEGEAVALQGRPDETVGVVGQHRQEWMRPDPVTLPVPDWTQPEFRLNAQNMASPPPANRQNVRTRVVGSRLIPRDRNTQAPQVSDVTASVPCTPSQQSRPNRRSQPAAAKVIASRLAKAQIPSSSSIAVSRTGGGSTFPT